MKHISVIKRNLFLALGAVALLTTSCIKEDLEVCKNFRLTLKVVRPDGLDITPLGTCRDANLYIFDENGKWLETRALDKDFITSRQEIELKTYTSGQKLHMVAWGNLGDQTNQKITEPKTLSDLKLKLTTKGGVASTPDSLFFGSIDVMAMDGGTSSERDTVVVRMKTGGYTIKTIGYDFYKTNFLKSTDDVAFTLDTPTDTYDHVGKQTGEATTYKPETTTDDKSDWLSVGEAVSPDFGGRRNAFAGDDMSCSIVVNGKTELTVTEAEVDGEMQRINIPETKRTDIFFVFNQDGTISVKMKITPWGVVDDNIEF